VELGMMERYSKDPGRLYVTYRRGPGKILLGEQIYGRGEIADVMRQSVGPKYILKYNIQIYHLYLPIQ
jgi:hypothetical protein